MAESALKASVDLLGKVLVEEGKYLWGAEGKVKELRDELFWMRSFLRKADALQYKDEIVSMWICQVQEYVYEAEDIIDEFVIKVVSQRQQKGVLNKLKRYSCIFSELYALHQAASGIDSLIVKISTLSPRLEKYGLMRTHGKNTDEAAHEARIEQVQQIMRNVHTEEKKIVGFEKNSKEIINALKSTSSKGFHAFYGMGGSGKTTLATKVLKDDETKQLFPGGQAFAYVSKNFQVETVFQDLLKGLTSESIDKRDPINSKEEVEKKSTTDKLREILKKKKCLVVLDDVWRKQDWDSLKHAFISCGGDSGSKVLLTTRKVEVARHVDPEALQKPDLLNKEQSWELLQKTMGWSNLKENSTSSENEQVGSQYDENENDPETLQKPDHLNKEESSVSSKQVHSKTSYVSLVETNAGFKWNMLRHYVGRPLSASLLVGLAKRKTNITEWASEHKELTDSIPIDFPQIFAMCYNDLQLPLRHCLIYIVNFPEDVEISSEKLYQMWIAAGFIELKQDSVETTQESLENVAVSYLTELVERGMVTVVKRGLAERTKTCRLKFGLRDLLLAKAKEEHTTSATNATPSADEQLHYSLDFVSSRTSPLCFPDVSDPLFNEEKWGLLLHICKHFQLLRILDLEGMWKTIGCLPNEIGNLTHLRYLSLRGTWVTQLPSSIESLSNLQTLDLRVMGSIGIPDVLWKLTLLMHLYLPAQETPQLQLHGLSNLQILVNLQTDKVCLNDLLELKLLRKISILKIHAVDEFVGVLNHLNSLLDMIISSEIINVDQNILSRFQNLQKVKIKGILLVELRSDMFPKQLKELTLKNTKLEDDPLPVLEKLPELTSLCLDHGSFLGKNMTFSEDFFKRTNLLICSLSNLEELYCPHWIERRYYGIKFVDCCRVEIKDIPLRNDIDDKSVHPRCFDLSPMKKVLGRFC